jgi:predicted nucleotidyltransferase
VKSLSPETSNIIARYREQLGRMGICVEKAILFGSSLRGEAQEGSDIDLLIVSPDFARMNTRERLELLGLAAARIWEPVETIGYTPQELSKAEPATLLQEILQTGVAVA